MEELPKHFFLLAAYHFFFFRKFYLNPYLNSTGELLSTFYPVTVWQGRQWNRGKPPLRDQIYYYEPASIPFLSTFYPVQIAVSKLIAILPCDRGFVVYSFVIYLHYLLSSLLAYILFTKIASPELALLCSISWTYAASTLRVGHPCSTYTICWVPGIFLGGWIGALSFFMSLTGGYWPVLIYFLPGFLMLPEVFYGAIPALPQIIMFANYFPRSIRYKQKSDHSFGRFPAMKLFDYFTGNPGISKVNGVLPWEMGVFIGIIPLICIFYPSGWLLVAVLYLILAMTRGAGRIPSRALIMANFAFIMCVALSGLSGDKVWILLIIQGYLLLRNIDMYPWFPFAEKQKKPSFWFNRKPIVNRFPYFTGYYHETPTNGYTGGFALRSTCQRNGVTDPNGKATHEQWPAY